MSGADRVKVPAQGQSLSDYGVGGNKQVSDLIDTDVTIAWSGTAGKVTGKVKKAEWQEFSTVEEEQSGHYFPFEVDQQYSGEDITVIGSKTTTANDLKWVIRLDKIMDDSKKLTVKAKGEEIFTLDFTGATMNES